MARPLTDEEKRSVVEETERLAFLDIERADIAQKLKMIRETCSHPLLPPREGLESYRFVCPDCGFVAYCYSM